MKYGLIIVLFLFQFVALGQQTSCLVMSKVITQNGTITYELTNKYNTQRQLVEKEERFAGQEFGKYKLLEKYVYDEKNNVIETATYVNEKFSKSVFRKFDNENKLVEEAVLTAEGGKQNITKIVNGNELILLSADEVSSRIVSEKDNGGRLMKESVFNSKGEIINSSTYTYNINGEVAVKEVIDMLNNRITATSFNRNNKGVIVEEIISVNSEPFRRIENSINNEDKIAKKSVFNRYDQLDYVITYTYDDKQNLTSESYFYKEQLITKTENTYDGIGNLVQQNNFERGKLISTLTWQYKCP